MARPLTQLLKKEVGFEWGEEQQKVMDNMKQVIIHSPALSAIDYSSKYEVVLAVDSSIISVGWMLGQQQPDRKRQINRFRSINWSKVQSRYSQPKIELFRLFRALRAIRLFIYRIKKLVIKMDAAYVKGMINNLDQQSNTTINR